jgi:hypothetical protein
MFRLPRMVRDFQAARAAQDSDYRLSGEHVQFSVQVQRSSIVVVRCAND